MTGFKISVFVALNLCLALVGGATGSMFGLLSAPALLVVGIFAGYGWASWADER